MGYDFLFHQDQRVICEIPGVNKNRIGKIVGCQTIPMPVIGRLYIVQFDSLLDEETYPFNTFCVPEIHIKLAKPTERWYVGVGKIVYHHIDGLDVEHWTVLGDHYSYEPTQPFFNDKDLKTGLVEETTEAYARELIAKWRESLFKNIAEKVKNIAKEIHDESEHIIGTEADDFNEIAKVNLERIQDLATKALKYFV